MKNATYTATNTARILARSTGLIMAVIVIGNNADIVRASDCDLDNAAVVVYPSGKIETLEG